MQYYLITPVIQMSISDLLCIWSMVWGFSFIPNFMSFYYCN